MQLCNCYKMTRSFTILTHSRWMNQIHLGHLYNSTQVKSSQVDSTDGKSTVAFSLSLSLPLICDSVIHVTLRQVTHLHCVHSCVCACIDESKGTEREGGEERESEAQEIKGRKEKREETVQVISHVAIESILFFSFSFPASCCLHPPSANQPLIGASMSSGCLYYEALVLASFTCLWINVRSQVVSLWLSWPLNCICMLLCASLPLYQLHHHLPTLYSCEWYFTLSLSPHAQPFHSNIYSFLLSLLLSWHLTWTSHRWVQFIVSNLSERLRRFHATIARINNDLFDRRRLYLFITDDIATVRVALSFESTFLFHFEWIN